MTIIIFLNLPNGEVLDHKIGPETQASDVLRHIDMTRLTYLTFEGEELNENVTLLDETSITSGDYLDVITELFPYKDKIYPVSFEEFGEKYYEFVNNRNNSRKEYWTDFDDSCFERIIRLQLKHEYNKDYFKLFKYDIDKFAICLKVSIELKQYHNELSNIIENFISHQCDRCDVCLKIQSLGPLLAQCLIFREKYGIVNGRILLQKSNFTFNLFFNFFVKYDKCWLIKSLHNDGVLFEDYNTNCGAFSDSWGIYYDSSIYYAIQHGNIETFDLLSSINDDAYQFFHPPAYQRYMSEKFVRLYVAFFHGQDDMAKHLIEKYNVSDCITLKDLIKGVYDGVEYEDAPTYGKIGAFDRLKAIFNHLETRRN